MEDDSKKLQARLAQLEIEMKLRDEAQQAVLGELLKKENELRAEIGRLQAELAAVPQERSLMIQEGAERHARLVDEYRGLEGILLQKGVTRDWAAVKEDYPGIKELLTASELPKHSAMVLQAERSCWVCTACITPCVQCVTPCVTCVTNACVQCVINGSGNLCSITSLVYSPCRPKVDIGEQITTRPYETLEVAWREDVPKRKPRSRGSQKA